MSSTAHLPELVTGTGPSVVLVHGWSGFKEGWGRLPEQLAAAGLRCVAVDLPGWGDASAPRRFSHRPEAYAAALVPVMERHAPIALIGHSMGCQAALIAARDHDLPALVALAPQWSPAPPRPPWTWRGMGRVRPGGRLALRGGLLLARRRRDAVRASFVAALARAPRAGDDPALLDQLDDATDRFARTSTRTLATSLAPLLDFDAAPLASGLEASTLVVLGERDRVISNRAAAEAISAAPRRRVVVVPEVAHFPHFEAPERVLPEVIDHLRAASVP